jgi:hypothetical protein
VPHTGARGNQAAGSLQDVRELLGADGGRSRWVQAADVGEADLAVAGPGDVVVSEERRAHCRDGDGDVAHAGEAGEELADVLAVAEVAWVRVVETVAGARGVLEDFKGEARGFDEVEEAGDGDGADVGQVQAFEVGGGLGDHCEIFIGHRLVQGVAEDLQTAKAGEIDAGVLQRVGRAIVFELFGLLGGEANALNFERVERLASARVDVQQIDPVVSGASSENSPGNAEELKVWAVGDDRQDETVGLGRVKSVEPKTADVLRDLRQEAEERVGLLQVEVRVAVDGDSFRVLDQLVQAVARSPQGQVCPSLRASPPSFEDVLDVVGDGPIVPLRANLADRSSGVPSKRLGAQRTADILCEFGVAFEWQRRLAEAVCVLFALCLVEAGGFQKDLIEDLRGELVHGHSVRVLRMRRRLL